MDEEDEPRINPVDGLYSPEQIENFGNDLRRKKCHILDCVLDTFPEHLKTRAKSMCDTLKCKDRLFILPSHEIVIDGEIDRGSNIRDYIMDSLVEPPVPGSIQYKLLEKENERLKQNLAYYEKALARARGVSRCTKFESIIDGTVDRCDFSDDTDSDESDGDEDSDETKKMRRMATLMEPKMRTTKKMKTRRKMTMKNMKRMTNLPRRIRRTENENGTLMGTI